VAIAVTDGCDHTGSRAPRDRFLDFLFHIMVLWRQHADFAVTYLTKGRQVYIEGRLQGRTWEAADGSQRRTVEVVADSFKALSPKPAPAA
jgi:single stranded DNA-binding protein